MSLIVKIDSETPDSLLSGKAQGIKRLLKNGLRVPETLCLTHFFFQDLNEDLNLSVEIYKLAEKFKNPQSQTEDLRRTCHHFEQQFLAKDFSLRLINLIKDIYYEYKKTFGSFCVRSSANIEDGQTISFAGVFESYLNISELDNFIQAIKYAYAQIFKYEVIINCLSHNINPQELKMSVIVQEYIQCEEYGVLFSKDPITSENNIIISTASDGAKLMSGELTGENFEVDPQNIPGNYRFKKLIEDAIACEKFLNFPVDIEWGRVRDKLIFFQLRPITTKNKIHQTSTRWSRDLAEERYPEPVSPLGWSILRDVFETNLKTLKNRFGLIAASPDDVAITVNNYVYVNDSFFSLSNMKPHFLSLLPNMINILKALILSLFFLPAIFIGSTIRIIKISVKDFLIFMSFKFFIFVHAKDILNKWDETLPTVINDFSKLEKKDLSKLNIDELLAFKSQLSQVGERYMEPDLAIYIVKMACQWIVKRIGKIYFKDIHPDKFLSLMSLGLENNRTLLMAVSLDELVKSIQGNGELVSAIQNKNEDLFYKLASANVIENLERFEEHNGHLTVNWDFRVPTWQENRTQLFSMLSSMLTNTQRKSIDVIILENNFEYQSFRENLQNKIKNKHMLKFVEELQFYLREFMRIDEEHHFYCSKVFKSLRGLYTNLGQRFVDFGVFHSFDDIFMLNSNEVDEICNTRNFYTRRYLVKNRKKSFLSSFEIYPPDEYVNGKANYRKINANEKTFSGMAASSGIVSGVVKIIHNLDDCHKIQAGDIIVTAAPNPVYVPLYSVASAIIANTGSILSHGMVAAREYGIPAVVGIPNISKLLKEGQKVIVNGDLGIITLLD